MISRTENVDAAVNLVPEVELDPQLDDDQKREVANWLLRNNGALIITKNHLSVYPDDIITLRLGKWLNSGVIEFYLELIRERSQHRNEMPNVCAISPLFSQDVPNMTESELKRKWVKKDISAMDYIFIPIYHPNTGHWCMTIVEMKTRTLEYYDSLGGESEEALKKAKLLLANDIEWK